MATTRIMVAIVVLGAASAPARGDGSTEARQHFARGARLSEQGDHRGAIEAFARSLALAERPNTLYMLGRAHMALAEGGSAADVGPAIDYFRRYVALQPGASDREEVEKRVSRLEKLRPPPPAATTAHEEPPPSSPEPQRIPEPAQPAAVVVPPPAPLAASTPPAAATTPVYKRWWLWTTVAAVVAVGVAVGVGVAYRSAPCDGCIDVTPR